MFEASWGITLNLTGLAMSMTVNALATGLIVFRIYKVFRQVKLTSEDETLGATGGNKLRSIIFVVESGIMDAVCYPIEIVNITSPTTL